MAVKLDSYIFLQTSLPPKYFPHLVLHLIKEQIHEIPFYPFWMHMHSPKLGQDQSQVAQMLSQFLEVFCAQGALEVWSLIYEESSVPKLENNQLLPLWHIGQGKCDRYSKLIYPARPKMDLSGRDS